MVPGALSGKPSKKATRAEGRSDTHLVRVPSSGVPESLRRGSALTAGPLPRGTRASSAGTARAPNPRAHSPHGSRSDALALERSVHTALAPPEGAATRARPARLIATAPRPFPQLRSVIGLPESLSPPSAPPPQAGAAERGEGEGRAAVPGWRYRGGRWCPRSGAALRCEPSAVLWLSLRGTSAGALLTREGSEATATK